jgi:flagellar biosynthesis protein FliR
MLTDEILNWFLVFARVGALFIVLPMFAMQSFPVRLRVALSALIALLVAPFLPPVQIETLSFPSLTRLLASEISVGLLLGFVCRLVFHGLETASSLLSTEMGLMMSSDFNQLSGSANAAPGIALYWLAIILWFCLDLHHWMIVALQRSYALVPTGEARLSATLLIDIIRRTSTIFVVAVQISAPIMAVAFMINLTFSMLGRAVPQMNVFFMSFPVQLLVGLLMFGLTCTFMAQHIINYLRRLPEDALRVAQLLGTG